MVSLPGMVTAVAGVSVRAGGWTSGSSRSAAVVRGAVCLRRDLDGSGEGTHFLRGGGDIREFSIELDSDIGTGDTELSDFVANIFPITESSWLDFLLEWDADANGRGDDEGSAISSRGSSSESTDNSSELLLLALVDILLSGGGNLALLPTSLWAYDSSLGGEGRLNCVVSCSRFSSMLDIVSQQCED